MFVERLSALPVQLSDFTPAPPASDRAAWSQLPADVRAMLVAAGEAALAETYPTLYATAYLEFIRSGDRVGYERHYFNRRRMLNELVLAECVEGSGRFLDHISDGLLLICEESGWQLPAHNAKARGVDRMALPDIDTPIIDLFAAETGAQLTTILALLSPELAAVTPEIAQRIDRELDRRIFRPYLDRHFWWMGGTDEPVNNWTAWCTQNVLLATFTRPTSQDIRRAVVTRTAISLDAFLDSYSEDGACEEGVLYYRHAALCLFGAIQVLDAAAPGCFTPLWREPKIRNMAEYPLAVHVTGQTYFNFADCPAVAERCTAREYLFGKAVGSEVLADFAARDWAETRRADLPGEINLFYRLQSAFTAPELAAHPVSAVPPREGYLPSVGLLTAHDGRFSLAVKAGDNGDSHNHNDIGSIILYKHGRPVLIDVGVESYTKKTFSADRYDIWTMQSAWHNLPTFEGVMQRDGETFAAREVVTSFAADTATIDMDIAGAYPAKAELRTYRRRVLLVRNSHVEIEDAYEGDRAAELSLMLAEEPRLESGRIILDDFAEILLEGAGDPRIETIPISDARLRQVWPERLYRVLIPIAGRNLKLRIV